MRKTCVTCKHSVVHTNEGLCLKAAFCIPKKYKYWEKAEKTYKPSEQGNYHL